MYNYLIKQYISRLSLADIKKLSINYDINLNDDEIKILYDHVKDNIDKFLNDNTYDVFLEIKDKIRNENYEKLKALYDKNINKLR